METNLNGKHRNLCGLKVPKDLARLPAFSVKARKLISPNTIDLRDWDLAPKDQGETPMCAAYAAASYAENLLWRKNSYPTEVKPEWIYRMAKKMDGDPDGEGTTLTAVLQALLDRGVFNPDYCKVKVLRTEQQVRFAIHKFGTCLVGINITEEYFDCDCRKHGVYGDGSQKRLGGHAMQCVGLLPQGIICRNSWGEDYGLNGNIIVAWEQFREQFVYGATLDNPLYDFHM